MALAVGIGNNPTTQTPSSRTVLLNNDKQIVDVVIVGGGLAGLALFCGLVSTQPKDTSIVLVEKYQHPTAKVGATLGFAKNGVKAVTELCGREVVDKIQSEAIDMEPRERVPVHVLPWWILRDGLLSRAKQLLCDENGSNAASMLYGMTLKNIKDIDSTESEFVTLEFEDNSILQARFVIGADGVHSATRRALGLPPAESTGMTVYRGHLQLDPPFDSSDETNDVVYSLLSNGYAPLVIRDGPTYFAMFNHHDKIPGLLLWVLGTPKPMPDGETKVKDLMQLFDKVLEEDESSATPCDRKQLLHQVLLQTRHDLILKTNLSTINMDSPPSTGGWGGRGRVTLVGDAAHACRPTDGQGANLAFEDCAVLCRMLLSTPTEKEGPNHPLFAATYDQCDSIIKRFESMRLPRVKTIHEDQRVRANLKPEEWTRWSPEFMKWVYDGV